MTTEAEIGHGSEWRRGDGADPEVFTKLAEITSINGISVTKDTEDATHMDSPERWEEVISSIKRTGEISIEMNFDPDGATTTNCLADVNSNTPKNYQFASPNDDVEWIILCHATGFELGVPMESKMTATATYKPTGKPGFIV
ncbi:phage tail tube protein [Lentilitoribacter sp. EG35]|uniref:phage tail tube protein n=1 Tax=Lentilitoribacter sp. EG35 TaxID=3234192 RepID=UPI00345F50D2